ncbi:unnamed protein product, partial [Staurois parvus]
SQPSCVVISTKKKKITSKHRKKKKKTLNESVITVNACFHSLKG